MGFLSVTIQKPQYFAMLMFVDQCPLEVNQTSASFADIDECSSSHKCDSSATCYNTDGSYICVCNSGYSGDGRTCRGRELELYTFLNATLRTSLRICWCLKLYIFYSLSPH